MQSAEDFMREFFHARTEETKRELQNRHPFRRKFFAEDCAWDSRRGDATRSESEEIIAASGSELEADVITQPASPFPKLCYHLQRRSQNWLITSVRLECLACGGRGDGAGCPACNGTGWLSVEEHLRQVPPPSRQPEQKHQRPHRGGFLGDA
jgi:hypothetical protein